FYKAVFGVLNIPLGGEADDHVWADELFISNKERKAAIGHLTARVHLAFQGKSREVVDKFHAVAIAAGGKDFGPPGERAYHPGYYRARVLDPDGNTVEVVSHGPAKFSAESVKVTF